MYKPNFCAECGEKIKRTDWTWRDSSRFCDDCALRLENKNKLWQIPLAAIVLFSLGIVTAQFFQPKKPAVNLTNNHVGVVKTEAANPQTQNSNSKSAPVPKPSVQTLVASPVQKNETTPVSPSNQLSATEAVYYCGARTQKGTPCSRRVRNGGRCWQHVGKNAILPAEKLLISPSGK